MLKIQKLSVDEITLKKELAKVDIQCLCGNAATSTAYLPMPNIYTGTRLVMEPHNVCDYHAAKARCEGYRVEEL